MPRHTGSSHGLQDREWEAPRLNWAQRALWVVFFAYVIGLIAAAKQIREAAGGWGGFALMLLTIIAGMLVWRKSLPARILLITTLVGRWSLTLGYWVLFAPWAFLVKRRDPLQLRRTESSWSGRTAHVATLAEATQQY